MESREIIHRVFNGFLIVALVLILILRSTAILNAIQETEIVTLLKSEISKVSNDSEYCPKRQNDAGQWLSGFPVSVNNKEIFCLAEYDTESKPSESLEEPPERVNSFNNFLESLSNNQSADVINNLQFQDISPSGNQNVYPLKPEDLEYAKVEPIYRSLSDIGDLQNEYLWLIKNALKVSNNIPLSCSLPGESNKGARVTIQNELVFCLLFNGGKDSIEQRAGLITARLNEINKDSKKDINLLQLSPNKNESEQNSNPKKSSAILYGDRTIITIFEQDARETGGDLKSTDELATDYLQRIKGVIQSNRGKRRAEKSKYPLIFLLLPLIFLLIYKISRITYLLGIMLGSELALFLTTILISLNCISNKIGVAISYKIKSIFYWQIFQKNNIKYQVTRIKLITQNILEFIFLLGIMALFYRLCIVIVNTFYEWTFPENFLKNDWDGYIELLIGIFQGGIGLAIFSLGLLIVQWLSSERKTIIQKIDIIDTSNELISGNNSENKDNRSSNKFGNLVRDLFMSDLTYVYSSFKKLDISKNEAENLYYASNIFQVDFGDSEDNLIDQFSEIGSLSLGKTFSVNIGKIILLFRYLWPLGGINTIYTGSLYLGKYNSKLCVSRTKSDSGKRTYLAESPVNEITNLKVDESSEPINYDKLMPEISKLTREIAFKIFINLRQDTLSSGEYLYFTKAYEVYQSYKEDKKLSKLWKAVNYLDKFNSFRFPKDNLIHSFSIEILVEVILRIELEDSFRFTNDSFEINRLLSIISDKCIGLINKYHRDNNPNPKLFNILGILYTFKKDNNLAKVQYRRASINSYTFWKSDHNLAILFLYDKLNLSRNVNDREKEVNTAIDLLKKAKKNFELNFEGNSVYSRILSSLGLAYIFRASLDIDRCNNQIQRDIIKSEKYLKRAIKLNPNSYQVYWNLGLVYLRKNNLERTLQTWKKAIHHKENEDALKLINYQIQGTEKDDSQAEKQKNVYDCAYDWLDKKIQCPCYSFSENEFKYLHSIDIPEDHKSLAVSRIEHDINTVIWALC